MPVAADRTVTARVKTYAIFVKAVVKNDRGGNVEQYIRRPYNIVEYDWNNGEPVRTYLQPAGRRSMGLDARAVANDLGAAYFNESYDDIRVYDVPPTFDTIYGASQYRTVNNVPGTTR